jgi:hypothetical protein
MIVKRLKYTDKDTAIADLIDKQVIDEDNNFLQNTVAVVYLGIMVDVKGTYDDETGEMITPTTFKDGYHIDLMLREDTDFGYNEINPDTPNHQFL